MADFLDLVCLFVGRSQLMTEETCKISMPVTCQYNKHNLEQGMFV